MMSQTTADFNVRVTSRPPLAVKSDPARDAAFKYNRAASDMVSYEDLLVAQYLEQLRRTKARSPPQKERQPSPYLQHLGPTNTYPILSPQRGKRQRPASAVPLRPHSANKSKPKIDAKFIANPDIWDPATPRDEGSPRPWTAHGKKKHRPASAPAKRVRPWSGMSWGRLSSRSSSGRKTKALYKEQPRTIVATAFKNGSREDFARVAAPNIKMLLETCTDRLHLGFAGRRIFLEDGIEIFTAEDIPKDGEIYVSMGENYKCPYTNARRNTILKNGAAWTMSGVVLPEEGKKKKTKPKLSKRMRALLDTKKVRIVVFRNGTSAESAEVVADLANMEEFLTGCTMRLDLRSHAKIVYDWTGNKITDLTDTPIIDSCLQPGGTPVLGPVWVSTGEGFDPKGAYDYNGYLKQVVKKRLKETKTYKSNLLLAKDDEKDQVTIPSILSLSDEEIYEALDMAENEVDQLESVLQTLTSNIKYLEPLLQEKEVEGSQYTMKHIRQVDFDDRLLGSKGLKLKVYENGLYENETVFYFNLREAVKGIKDDKDKIMERLLDELSASQRTTNPQHPKISALARKLYSESGNEITDVRSLEYGQEVWLSYGEPFIVPFTYCLQVQFGIVEGYELDDGRQVVLTKFVDRNDKPLEGKDNPAYWDGCESFPSDYEFRHMSRPEEIAYINSLLEEQELELGAHFLQNTKEPNMVIYPEVAVSRKLPGERSDKTGFMVDCSWQTESQIFAVSKAGYIYCKSMPKLCLGVSDFRVEVREDKEVDEAGEGEGTHSEGLAVLLQRKTSDNPNQRWTFNTDGTISSVAYPDLRLTCLGDKFQGHLNYAGPSKNTHGLKPGNKVVLIMSDKLANRDASSQRFALKQEKFETIGQWKHTDVANNEWKKLAYSWPVKQDGELNEDYIWPLESFLMVNAPNPAKKTEKKNNLSGATPLRLSALRNGEREKSTAVLVVGPNLSNWMNATSKHEKEGGKHGKQKSRGREEPHVPVDVDVDMSLHCHDMTIKQLEFSMFLDACTALLDLPFAARRLFDEKGNEHFSLQDLKRDQLVYASCGEPWTDPSVTKAEQQRRFLLSQLSQDISQMRHYCALRSPSNFNLEVESLIPNARLLINRQWTHDLEQEETTPSETSPLIESYDNSKQSADIDATIDDNLTSHERSHLKSNDRLNRLKWPWERLVNAGANFDLEDPEATKYTDKQMYEKYKPKVSPRIPRDILQKFRYEDGYILCESCPELVLGMQEQEGRVKEVILVKKRPDDIHQRWVIKDTGEMRSKHNQQLVLTVVMPQSEPDDSEHNQSLTFVGSAVTLQARKASQYGRANQLWHYDAETGYISAFHTNELDKEITAANTVDVCSYTVAGFSTLTQPGYQVQIPAPAYTDRQTSRQIKVCTSCARAMRGRCKVERLPPQASFSCAMGQAKKQKLKQVGSFRVLNGKVDLSRHEAEHSLKDWEEVLMNLKNENNIRSIAKGISAAKTVRPVRILAYKNGEGRLNAGEVIIGSSVKGILQQCTKRLELSNHATRLYTEDGTLILDIHDLVEWASDSYKSAMYKQVDRLIQQQQQGLDGKTGLAEEEEEEDETEERGYNKGLTVDTGEDSAEKTEVEAELETAMGSLNLVQEGQTRPDGEGANSDDNIDKNKSQSGFNTDDIMSQVPLPSLDIILRYPVEIWVSTGKAFVPPEVVESRAESRKKKRAFRSAVSVELDVERHILRQMKGRRFGEQAPGSYKGTRNSIKPVILEGHWQEVSTDEQLTHEKVNKLESHLAEVKANQKEGSLKTVNVTTTRRLYKQPNMKRVMVFPNGETLERAVYIWGEHMEQLLDQASAKLHLWRRVRCFFTLEGKRVEEFDNIEKDQLLCASTSHTFKHPPASRQDVEVKANWSRARKQYGPTATDYKVDVAKNPKVNVDPFGPPELALPQTGHTSLPTSTPVPSELDSHLNSARMASDVSA